MQTIEQYLIPNGYAGANVTADGAASSELPYLVVGMPCQFVAHVVDAEGNPATPAGLANVESWKFVLAGDFDPETAPCFTTDEIVWDPVECAWTVLLDGTRTATMLALLGDEPWVNIGCEVVGLGEDEDWAHPAYVLQWTARIRGRRDSDGLGVHPATGERVANVLSADRGAELRVKDDGNIAITVPGASAPVVVTPAQIAAVAQNAITPEERAKWNDRERIVSANGKTELRARDGGSATLGVLDIRLGNAVATFPPGGGNFAVWTDEVSWQPKKATNTVYEFVGPYPGIGYGGRVYWVPKDGDQFTNYNPTAATSGWHLSAPNGATTPEVLQYRDGPGFTISGWETGAPTLEPLSGTQVQGTFWFTRPDEDATDYRNVSKEGHTHEGVVHGDTELAAVNGGGAVIRRTQDAQKTCLASATLSWSYTGGGGQASGTVDLTIPADEHVSVAELAAGVESFRLHAKVYIVVNTGVADGVLTPNWFEGDCTATLDGAATGGASYTIASLNSKLDGGSLVVLDGGVAIFSWHDDWHKDVPVEVTANTRTAQATRTDTVAVVTESPVGNPETDKTLSVLDKPADGKAVGNALTGKASTADAALAEVSVLTDWVFADGLLEAAQANIPIEPPSELFIDERNGVAYCGIGTIGQPHDQANEFCICQLSADGSSAIMTNGIQWALAVVPVGGTVATRSAVSGYRLGSQTDKPLAPAGNYALKSEIPDISGKLDAVQRNLLDYTSGTTLALGTAVYRSALNADGTFPTITDAAIPTAAAYYQFELELAVPSTVPSTITGPTGWDWLDGGEPPDPTILSGGETIFVACRMDCATRAVTANVWRIA